MKNFLSIGLFSICTILALTAYSKEVSLDIKKLDDINVSRLEEKKRECSIGLLLCQAQHPGDRNGYL